MEQNNLLQYTVLNWKDGPHRNILLYNYYNVYLQPTLSGTFYGLWGHESQLDISLDWKVGIYEEATSP